MYMSVFLHDAEKKGMAEGLESGRKQGLEQGMKQGKAEAERIAIKKMLKKLSIEEIIELGYDRDFVLKIAKES